MAGDTEDTGDRSGHQPVHDEQADEKHSETEHSESGATEVGCEKEDEELTWGFGSETVHDADDEDRPGVKRWVRRLLVSG